MEKYISWITNPITAFRGNVKIIKFLIDQYSVFFLSGLLCIYTTMHCNFKARSATKTKFVLYKALLNHDFWASRKYVHLTEPITVFLQTNRIHFSENL